MPEDFQIQYDSSAVASYSEWLGVDTPTLGPGGLNITAQGVHTNVHHDTEPHICTTGIFERGKEHDAAKLWIFWPSSEQPTLIDLYMKRDFGILPSSHGWFLVQKAGEMVQVPNNTPHALIALQSCYVYGRPLEVLGAGNPANVALEIAAGENAGPACWKRLTQLRAALKASARQHLFVQHFLKYYFACEAIHVKKSSGQFNELVRIWAEYLEDTETCPFCNASGTTRRVKDAEQHVKAHLHGQIPRA